LLVISNKDPGDIMGSNEGADDVLRFMGLENGATSPFDGGRALCSETTNSGEERNSLIKPEDKRITVKGLRNNKQKNLNVDSMDIAGNIVRSYEGAGNKARLMDLGNVIAALLGERIRNFLVKPPVLVERGRKL
jgi:lysine-specific demethylase 3